MTQKDLLIHDGYAWHYSKPNISNQPRMGVSVRFILEKSAFDPRPGQGAAFTKQINVEVEILLNRLVSLSFGKISKSFFIVKKILLLGSTGILGSHFLRELKKKSFTITSTRNELFNIYDYISIFNYLKNNKFDLVINYF